MGDVEWEECGMRVCGERKCVERKNGVGLCGEGECREDDIWRVTEEYVECTRLWK